MGLHVQLDVEYASDDRMVEAGPMAELLYVRSLCFAKKNPKTNGEFTAAQLTLFAHGIPQARKHAARLAELHAWETTDRGWRIASWLRRNKSGEDIAASQEMASEMGQRGNHERWHVGEGGKPSPKCALCIKAHRASGNPIGGPSGDPIGSTSPKVLLEEQEEEEPAAEPATRPDSPDNYSGAVPDARAAAALDILVDHRVANTAKKSPAGLRRTLYAAFPAEHGPALATYLRKHPKATVEELAAVVLEVPGVDWSPLPDYHVDPNCPECAGSGTARIDDAGQGTYGPCGCRRPEPYPDADVLPFERRPA